MKGLKQEKRGVTNSLVFTNADNTVGELSFNGAVFDLSDPVTFAGAQLLLNDGLAESPSLAFTNSTGVGLYRYGSNVLGFSTAGSVRMLLTAAGVLTLGTISIDSIGSTITGGKKSVTAGTTTTVLTAADSGKTFYIKAVGAATYTLPAPAAGLYFKWLWTVDNTDAVIIKTADIADTTGDIFLGGLLVCAATAVNTFVETATADTNTITMEDDAAKCGGGIGSWIEVICTEDPIWFVHGVVNSNTDADNVGVGLFTDAD